MFSVESTFIVVKTWDEENDHYCQVCLYDNIVFYANNITKVVKTWDKEDGQ